MAITNNVGSLKIQITNNNFFPVEGASIYISPTGMPDSTSEEFVTDENGIVIDEELPAPDVDVDGPLAMQCVTIDHSNFVGRIGIGRVFSGTIHQGDSILVVKNGGERAMATVKQLFTFDYLGRTGAGIPKASRRDLPVLVAQGKDGACTVTTTMMIADMAGIRVFATGGIGGVHRGAQETFDISADLEELANTSVMVVCAGAKSILDLGLTLEYLETHGVTVIGYGTSELPAFYTRKSGFGVDYELDTPEQLAKAFHVKRELGLRGGLLVTNPIPEEYSMDKEVIDKAIAEAVEDAKKDGIHGKATTPYLLAKIKDLTGGDSLDSNIQLVFNNARLGAAAAVELSKLEK